MTSAAPWPRLLLPGLSTLAMLAVLLFLGTWQVERLAWKQGLLDIIADAEQRPAISLPDNPPPFAKVRVEGVFDPSLSALYGAEVRSMGGVGTGGGRQLGVLRREGAVPVLVDRGWVPVASMSASADIVQPVPAGPVVVEGYVRPADQPGMFTPDDDVVRSRFYTLDPRAIGPALGVDAIAPFVLVAMGPPPPQGYPEPASALPRPPNNHLVYAATWYGLAVVLLAIFVLYARKVLRP